jgi:hypothetical protein
LDTEQNQKKNWQQWLRLKNVSTPEIISQVQAKAAVNKMKGAVTKATPPSEESDNMKAKRKTVMGKDSKVERQIWSHSAKSKVDNKSGEDDIDRTGIKSITKAASAVAALSGPAKRNMAAAATAPKKTKVK